MAPNAAGTNVITQNEDLVVETLANLASFQAWVDTVGDITETKKRIIVEVTSKFDGNDEFFANTPFVLVSAPIDEPQGFWSAYSKDIPYAFQCDTAIELTFFQKPPSDWRRNKEDGIRDFKNSVGDIMTEFKDESGNPGKFGTTEIEFETADWTREDNKETARLFWHWRIRRQQEASQ